MTALLHAVRTLLKTPSFTIIALVTLALGIGVNTSMYTLMDVLLFRAAPFPEPDQLVVSSPSGRPSSASASPSAPSPATSWAWSSAPESSSPSWAS